MCFLSPGEYFITIILPSEVWRGLDKMQAEQPESYSRMLEESVQWQNKANSLPEPCKVNPDYKLIFIIDKVLTKTCWTQGSSGYHLKSARCDAVSEPAFRH